MTEKSEFEELCSAVGLMTLTWAYAENGLAFMLKDIAEKLGPIKGHDKARVSLKAKLGAFRAALRSMPTLDILQHEGRALAMRFGHLGKRRNDFVHSAAFNLEDGRFETVSLRAKGRDYLIENKCVDVANAVLLNAEIALRASHGLYGAIGRGVCGSCLKEQ